MRQRSSRQEYIYKCSRCETMPVPGDNMQSRDLLLKKKVVFETLTHRQARRVRTVAWLCPDCCLRDEDYMSEAFPSRPRLSSITDFDEYLALTDPSTGGNNADPAH